MITKLKPNQIFVFGSNLQGHHDAGAAKTALEKFGAIYGKGVGAQGQSYAIPTMGGWQELYQYVQDFWAYFLYRPHKEFLLTPIGCGIAGYKPEEIAPLFRNAPSNVVLPKEFLEVLEREPVS